MVGTIEPNCRMRLYNRWSGQEPVTPADLLRTIDHYGIHEALALDDWCVDRFTGLLADNCVPVFVCPNTLRTTCEAPEACPTLHIELSALWLHHVIEFMVREGGQSAWCLVLGYQPV